MGDKQKTPTGAADPIAIVPPPTNGQTVVGPDVVGVDKIRDLLFGNQMQDYDRRFSKLEERFLQRFKEIESETARNLSAHDSNSKKQVDSLASQLREEKKICAAMPTRRSSARCGNRTSCWRNACARCRTRLASLSAMLPIASLARCSPCTTR